MSATIAVFDYGSGNLHSATRALAATGARVVLTADADEIAAADGLGRPRCGSVCGVHGGA
ncbi:hypothetical protein [Propioniciclava flava]